MRSAYIQDRINRFSDGGRYFNGTYDEDALSNIDHVKEKFPLHDALDFTFYEPRKLQRYLLVKNHYQELVGDNVLDVGSRDKTVEEIFNKKCTLLDKNSPELEFFDWEEALLPYADNSFNTVICLDTLEHINDIHRSFDDLARVTSDSLIISLPNCWRKNAKHFLRGYGSGASYGIPPEKPMDRHKWFFNTEDVDNFFFYRAHKNGLEVVGVKYHAPKTRLWHKILYPVFSRLFPTRFKNLLVETIIVCFKKASISQ